MTKEALVVGAAGGVGTTVVDQLVRGGYRVVGTVMDAVQRDALKRDVPGISDIAIIDLADGDRVAAGLAPLLREQQPLNAVAVCAAIAPYGPLETTPLSVLRRTLEINAIADVAVYQAVMPHLRRTKGRMAMISSMAGRVAFPFLSHYACSKFALEALADVMRREAAKWGVEIILVEPGGIQTPMVLDQQKTIVRDKAALSEEIRNLYGELYDGFEKAVYEGYDNSLPPSAIAEVMVKALTDTARPEPRYPVGPDSVYLCEAARSMSDRELDKVARLDTATHQISVV